MNNQYNLLIWLGILIVLALLVYWIFRQINRGGKKPPKPPFTTVIPEITQEPPPFTYDIVDDVVVCNIGEEIEVKLPFQTELNTYLYAVNLPIGGGLGDFESKEDQFKPQRLVRNFEAIDAKNREVYVSDFNPPMALRVQYTEEDVTNAGGLTNLQLGFWNEEVENPHWVSFRERTGDKYHFKIDGNDAGGFVEVTISSWGDRHIGFG